MEQVYHYLTGTKFRLCPAPVDGKASPIRASANRIGIGYSCFEWFPGRLCRGMSGQYEWKLGQALPVLGAHSVAKHDIFEQYVKIYIEQGARHDRDLRLARSRSVAQLPDRIIVLRDGVIREVESTGRILAQPKNHYTKSLLTAAKSQVRAAGNGTMKEPSVRRSSKQ